MNGTIAEFIKTTVLGTEILKLSTQSSLDIS
jgi:hypothetical protein